MMISVHFILSIKLIQEVYTAVIRLVAYHFGAFREGGGLRCKVPLATNSCHRLGPGGGIA